jgi:predicted metalloprotease
MRWRNQRRSRNVIDRRGQPARRRALGGGVIVLALLAAVFFGVDPSILLETLGGLQQTSVPAGPASPRPAAEDEAAEFVSVVLADTEMTWQGLFQQAGGRYQLPKLVLFTDSVTSACGMASAAAGPFYCPGDSQLYLDLGFLAELQRMGKAQANVLQVSMELQADCYAGVWAHHANGRNLLEAGDIEEGLSAASSVGDDHLQRMAGRRVTPESFTHGSSKQRMQWFGRGFESGNADACDTFGS